MSPAPLHLDEVTFRVADMSDREEVVAMLRELVLELDPGPGAVTTVARLDRDIRTALASDDVRIELAMAAGTAIALSRADIIDGGPIFRLRDDHRCGYVDQMFVRPAWRDTGVGQALLHRCEDWFRTRGIVHVTLHAAPKAVRFYARSGFQPNREMFKFLNQPSSG